MKKLHLVLLFLLYTIAVRDAATGESLWKQETETGTETSGTSSWISQLFVRKLLEARGANEIKIGKQDETAMLKGKGNGDEADDDDSTEMETELMLPDETDEESIKVEDGKGKEQKKKEQKMSETEEGTNALVEDTQAKKSKKEETKENPLTKSKLTSSSEQSSKLTEDDGNEDLKLKLKPTEQQLARGEEVVVSKSSPEEQQRVKTNEEKLKKKKKRAKEGTILDAELGEDIDEAAKRSNASKEKLLESKTEEEPKLKHKTETTLQKDMKGKNYGKKGPIKQRDTELVEVDQSRKMKQQKKGNTSIKRTTPKTQLEEDGGVELLEEAAFSQEEGSTDGTVAKKPKMKEAKKAPVLDLDVAEEEVSSDEDASKQAEDDFQAKLPKKGEKKKDTRTTKQKDVQGKPMKEKKKQESLKMQEDEDIEVLETKEVNLASDVEASRKNGGKKPLGPVVEEENEGLDGEEEVQSKSEEDFGLESESDASSKKGTEDEDSKDVQLSNTADAKSKKETPAKKLKKREEDEDSKDVELSNTADAKSKKETPAKKLKKREEKPVVLQEGSEEEADDTLPDVDLTQNVKQAEKKVKKVAKRASGSEMEIKEVTDKKSKKAVKRASDFDMEKKEGTVKKSKVVEDELNQGKEPVKSLQGKKEEEGLDSKVDSEEKLDDKESWKPGSKGTEGVDGTISSSAQGSDDDNDDDNYEYGDFIKGFNELPSKFQDTAQKVAGHLGPNFQKITDTSKNYFDKANQQISESFTPLVGKQFAPLFASLISYGLLLVPLAVVVVLLEHIRALLSLQKVMLFVNIYLAAYFVTLLLATFIIGEPMNFFFRSSPSGYIHLQLLQALGYIIYLILQTFDLVSCCTSEALLIKITTTLQWLVAFGVGLHYYMAVFHRAMGMKGPRMSWKIYGVYSIAFCVLCLFVRLKRTKKEYTQLGESDTNKKN